jgi:hypothetical protein
MRHVLMLYNFLTLTITCQTHKKLSRQIVRTLPGYQVKNQAFADECDTILPAQLNLKS